MAKGTRSTRRGNSTRGSIGSVLLGGVIGCGLLVSAIALYFFFGHPPVAVTDSAAVWEPLVEDVPLRERARTASKAPPFPAGEEVFESAARTYRARCVVCHGSPGRDAALGRTMQPQAQQFFSANARKSAGAQQPGELYWKTAFGIRRSGMPAYRRTLTDTQLWQLSLLLHSAGDALPEPVRALLTEGDPAPEPTVVEP